MAATLGSEDWMHLLGHKFQETAQTDHPLKSYMILNVRSTQSYNYIYVHYTYMPAPPTTLHDQTPISDNFGVSSGVHYSLHTTPRPRAWHKLPQSFWRAEVHSGSPSHISGAGIWFRSKKIDRDIGTTKHRWNRNIHRKQKVKSVWRCLWSLIILSSDMRRENKRLSCVCQAWLVQNTPSHIVWVWVVHSLWVQNDLSYPQNHDELSSPNYFSSINSKQFLGPISHLSAIYHRIPQHSPISPNSPNSPSNVHPRGGIPRGQRTVMMLSTSSLSRLSLR